ncbi:twin-arginine translocation signal domain-containing protein [Sulfurospirillum halorespirans]|uniref:Formate dehydrogenase accessory protein FdhE n=1 Tax=Sulfurospirillum halorespirans DSM 13726 TaxID=1193502 RepID=A0A1D7TN86_9BACT|nr:twin-arginine translocation signal domain-containing protein [Sulfurospirillum halorespirans]AOO66443.1 formate dehydrogenase accessory protein FdhE [Sulfurospirillum halorespirans DSM 13726]
MQDQRRSFLKKTLSVGAVAATVSVGAIASDTGAKTAGSNSNGVVKGKSKKKEILYTKTANWDAYYHAAV